MRALIFLIPSEFSQRKSHLPKRGQWNARISVGGEEVECRIYYKEDAEIYPGSYFISELKLLRDRKISQKSFEVLELGIVGLGVFID